VTDPGEGARWRSPLAWLFVRAAGWLVAFAAGVVLVVFNIYVFGHNDTNHTGGDTLAVGNVFLLLACAALAMGVLCVVWTGHLPREIVVAAALSALVTICTHFYDEANIMVQYDRWLARGMPDRPCIALFAPGLTECARHR
jgi:hypothetical protein